MHPVLSGLESTDNELLQREYCSVSSRSYDDDKTVRDVLLKNLSRSLILLSLDVSFLLLIISFVIYCKTIVD